MERGDLRLDHGAPHGGMRQPVGGNTQRYQACPARDEPVRVPVGQQPPSFYAVIRQDGPGVEGQVAGKKRNQRVRPANRAVHTGHVAGAEERNDFLILDVQPEVHQPG